MIKKIIVMSAIFLTFAFVQTTWANMDKGSDSHCACKHMKGMLEKLNLTPEQQTKIKTIKDQAKTPLQTNRKEMKAIRQQIDALVQSDKLDETKLNTLIAQKKELMASGMKTRVMMKHQIYQTLDTEQKAKFAAMKEQCAHKPMDKASVSSKHKAKQVALA